jgi:hypothetical protein
MQKAATVIDGERNTGDLVSVEVVFPGNILLIPAGMIAEEINWVNPRQCGTRADDSY